jgi:hypothetical protein
MDGQHSPHQLSHSYRSPVFTRSMQASFVYKACQIVSPLRSCPLTSIHILSASGPATSASLLPRSPFHECLFLCVRALFLFCCPCDLSDFVDFLFLHHFFFHSHLHVRPNVQSGI